MLLPEARRLVSPALAAAVKDAGRALPGATAAFDADGTLWREDVGEAFLRHLIELGMVKLPSGRDPYEVYEEKVAQDKAAGYAYASQLLAGLRRDDVARAAANFAPEWVAPRLIATTQALLLLCAEAGLLTAVVSASSIEIVLAAAPIAGVPASRCMGMTVRTLRGEFTDEIVPPVTYAEGKVAALEKAAWLPLAVAGGDSISGDLAMLSLARVPVVVAPAAGSPLAAEAAQRGWTVVTQG